SACGGFFCSNDPMDQSGERILFGLDGDTVTAQIQIFYQGDAEKFAWVLPIPAEPTSIGVGTDALFQRLQSVTQPRFQIDWANQDGCWYQNGWLEADTQGGGEPPNAVDDQGSVTVLQELEVGPYNAVVVKANGGSSDDADALFEWLDENGYDQPEMARDLIATYVAEKHVFVAIKLQSDKAAGDIVPLTLEYPFLGSCVPLRLTSIAATEDMDVWVYVLGRARAIPVNYFEVKPNPAKIDWFNWGSNYQEVASAAVNAAAGRGFITEYAGDTLDMKDVLYQPDMYNLDALALITTPWEMVDAMLMEGIPRNATTQNIIRTWIPKPEALAGLSDQEFYNNLEQYQQELSGQVFDPVGMVDDIRERLVKPLEVANGYFEKWRYMTRLYTIISPNEMSRDPIFLENPDLPDVSNVHIATGTAICPEGTSDATKVQLTLSDGTELMYDIPDDWAPATLEGGTDDLAPAAEINRMYTAGAPEPVSDSDIARVDAEFDTVQIGLITQDPSMTSPSRRANASNAGGCTSMGHAPVAGLAVLSLGVLAVLGFRRRRLQG
ncbi:MAG: DUF2330 domain-containing protein, partial [Myxococcota bacterium]|nr:DUF2330 domain-containing protein [Myxococcota bacterium]